MKSLLSAALVFAVTAQSAFGEIVRPEDYSYPISNRYAATITSAANHATVPFKPLILDGRADRDAVPLLNGRNRMTLAMYLQPAKAAPVAFVISGTGGNALSGSSLMLAQELQALGYHAITLPDPMCWEYALNVSESAAPGYVPRDSKEFYEFMKLVAKKLADQGIVAQSYSVVGYSLGGLLAGFLAQEDVEQGYFGFQRAVMINPAMDIGYDIGVLDDLYRAGDSLTQDQKDVARGDLMNVGASLVDGPVSSDALLHAVGSLKVSAAQMQWIIGDSFRSNLGDMVFANQQIHDDGLLAHQGSIHHLNARLDDAKSLTFMDYMTKIVIPTLGISGSEIPKTLLKGSFYALEDFLSAASNVYLMENADDLLLKPGDVDILEHVFGDRTYLYPLGGHVGNLWFDRNRADFAAIMRLQ